MPEKQESVLRIPNFFETNFFFLNLNQNKKEKYARKTRIRFTDSKFFRD